MKVPFAYRLMNCVKEKSKGDRTSKMSKQQPKKAGIPHVPIEF